MFGKEENISTKGINIENDVSHLMSGKSYPDENFPVASFLMTKKIRSIVRVFYFFARMADDIADHQKLSSNQKKKFCYFLTMLFQKVRKLITRF